MAKPFFEGTSEAGFEETWTAEGHAGVDRR